MHYTLITVVMCLRRSFLKVFIHTRVFTVQNINKNKSAGLKQPSGITTRGTHAGMLLPLIKNM